ncbi:carbohydrate-binding domain-containing protein [Fusicatenibacter saccharivorans]|uniref:Carbohydrate-binding domain-containing protein n=1 Tax=Fusicatenibacter saccharivorans TaxID=1150298 RepID=A0ABX2GI96_9FIRM|nr:carbohydrate-binding domain-containing protein [Fusicatenibacter saccharivorans]NSE11364.1 carbohydrate-binding domain-containing protein [Fusicatenibacter saccharivorans]NSE18027.1 carbohydrate-binding domain-containing protein [Fusicatenibacter saccharivorans]
MNRNRKKKNRKKETGAVVSLLLASSLAFGGCGTAVTSSSSVNAESARTESTGETSADNADTTSESTDSENAMESASDINFDLELTESTIDTEFTDREKSGSYKALEAVKITLNKTTATVSGSGAKADGSTITITEEGVYVVSGTLEDGQIIVDASDSDKVQIVLDGVHINCETNAAIYVREADKVFITLAENSSNTLGGGNEYTQIDDNTVDGVIFSKSDLVCNGTGSLTIEADYKHGIVSKDDLVITGGTYKIATADNGITAKDQIKILDGSFDIDAANSAVKAKNTDDTELGNIYIAGGIFTIEAEQDGFHADLDTVIHSGTILVEKSYEGLEGKRVVVNGGDITINASDDGINAANSGDDGANAINPGANAVGSGDDDSNAASSNNDSSAAVNSGDDVSISGEADGKEPQQMPPDTENGSDMQPSQDFDPENAPSGGNAPQDFDPGNAPSDGDAPQMMQGGPGGGGNSELYIKITGGTLTVSADGDGLDSNGGLLVTGGTTIVYGPTSDGDSALDYDGSAIVTGGTLAAICSAGMTESFDEASTQPVITYYSTETQSADTTITLTDSDGSALFTVTPEKAYASIVLTCPEMKLDATYTLAAGTDNEEIILTDIITTAGTRSVKTMSDPEGGKMPNNSDNKGTPPSKPSDTAE